MCPSAADGQGRPDEDEGHRATHGLLARRALATARCLKTFNVTRKAFVQPVEDDNPIYEGCDEEAHGGHQAGLAGEDQGHVSWGRGRGPGSFPLISASLCENCHAHFTRDGLNLLYIHTISLSSALCGHTVNIKHLDGRTLNDVLSGKWSPGYEKMARERAWSRARTEAISPLGSTSSSRSSLNRSRRARPEGVGLWRNMRDNSRNTKGA